MFNCCHKPERHRYSFTSLVSRRNKMRWLSIEKCSNAEHSVFMIINKTREPYFHRRFTNIRFWVGQYIFIRAYNLRVESSHFLSTNSLSFDQ